MKINLISIVYLIILNSNYILEYANNLIKFITKWMYLLHAIAKPTIYQSI